MATSPALKLYGAVPSRANIVHWMLEELGEPYEYRRLDLMSGEHKRPEYFAINPMGKVPALEHNGVVITEAAAICAYLADAFPASRLAPAIGDPNRGPYLKWMFYGPSCVEPAMLDKMLNRPEGKSGAVGWGNYDLVMSVLESAVSKSPYILGDTFSAADVVIGSGINWGMLVKAIEPKPVFVEYVERLKARPAHKRQTENVAAMMKASA